jgi:hypothetical protein
VYHRIPEVDSVAQKQPISEDCSCKDKAPQMALGIGITLCVDARVRPAGSSLPLYQLGHHSKKKNEAAGNKLLVVCSKGEDALYPHH